MSGPALWAYPNIDPVAIRLGPVAVRWYGIAYLCGFLFAWWLLRRLNERWSLGLSEDDRWSVMLWVIVGLMVGARLGYVLFYGFGAYLAAPLSVFAVWDGGMSFHGGLVGLLVAGWMLSRSLHVPYLRLCDFGAVAAPVGLALGRLGNFINGELWGRPSDLPWAMIFPDPAAGGIPRHPSQLYEALVEGVVLLCVMMWLARRRRPAGELLGWFLLLYGFARILLESLREPDVQIGFVAGGVTMGQLLSVPMVLAGIALVWWVRRSARQKV